MVNPKGLRGGTTDRSASTSCHKQNIWLGVELVQARPGFQSFGYGMIKPSPFRLVVRTSSFHVEETGSIPVRDNLLGEASEGPPRVGQEVHGTVP